MWFHIIQILLTVLIALAVYLLTEGLEGRAVMVSRWAADERSPGWRRPAGYPAGRDDGSLIRVPCSSFLPLGDGRVSFPATMMPPAALWRIFNDGLFT
jgi:hypothetical protein